MTTYNDALEGKILSYFMNRYRGMFKSTKGWYRLDCPFCFGKKSFGINPTINISKCHKCDYKNRLVQTVAELEEKETFNDTLVYIDSNFENTHSLFKKAKKIERKEVELPESFRLLSLGKSFIARTARAYAKKRGFNVDYLTTRGVGYCEEGKYEGSLVFPFYYNGVLVYYTNRRFLMGLGSGRKFDNPPEEEFGIGKSKLIYNRDALFLYKKVQVVESVTNALTLRDRAIALGGKAISDYQFGELLKSPVEQFDILLDPDALGNAIDLAMRLVRYKKVRLIFWPGNDDINKMGRRKTIDIIKGFRPQSYIELNHIKRTYESNPSTFHTYYKA